MTTEHYDIVGHQRQRDYLSRLLSQSVMRHHMMIFTGPSHIGKATIARCFAHAYVTGHDGAILWETAFLPRTHEEIIVLAPQAVEEKGITKVKKISVEQVRQIIKRAQKTTRSGRRFLLVDDADLMTSSAANALLKIIEEPPAGMVVIFVSTDKARLLPTVLSRGMIVSFDLCASDEVSRIAHLTPAVCELAPQRPGLACTLMHDESLRQDATQAVSDLKEIRSWSVAQRLSYAQDLAKDVVRAEYFLETWLMRTRDVAHDTRRYDVLAYSRRILETLLIIRSSNASARIALENMLLHF